MHQSISEATLDFPLACTPNSLHMSEYLGKVQDEEPIFIYDFSPYF